LRKKTPDNVVKAVEELIELENIIIENDTRIKNMQAEGIIQNPEKLKDKRKKLKIPIVEYFHQSQLKPTILGDKKIYEAMIGKYKVKLESSQITQKEITYQLNEVKIEKT